MPLDNNLNRPARHQKNPSVDMNIPVYSSINQMPADQMAALVSNLANATIADFQST